MSEDAHEFAVTLTKRDIAALTDAITITGADPLAPGVSNDSIRNAIKFWTYIVMERKVRGCTFLIFNKDTKETNYLQMGFDTDLERQGDREAVNILTAASTPPEPEPEPEPELEPIPEDSGWMWRWPAALRWLNAVMIFMAGGVFFFLLQITLHLVFGV